MSEAKVKESIAMGNLRLTQLFDKLCNQKTIRGVASIFELYFQGKPLIEESNVKEFHKRTGEPKKYVWKDYNENRSEPFVLWPSTAWNFPSVKGTPIARTLRVAKEQPIVVGEILISYKSEHSDQGGTIPECYKFRKVKRL